MENVNIHDFPVEMTREYLNKLSNQDLKSICSVNKEYYIICRDLKIWKSRLQQDYPVEFKELPKPLNEPNWRKVYYYVEGLVELRKKFSFIEKKDYKSELVDPTNTDRNLFVDTYSESAITFNRLLASMLVLGAQFVKDYFSLIGDYRYGSDSFRFQIDNGVDVGIINLSNHVEMPSKIKDRMIEDLRNLIINTLPIFFYKQGSDEVEYKWNPMDDLFTSYVPNVSDYQPYEYYYTSNLVADYKTSKVDYITEKVWPHDEIVLYTTSEIEESNLVEPVVKFKSRPVKSKPVKIRSKSAQYISVMLSQYFPRIPNRFKLDTLFLGNYTGVPFILYTKKSDNHTYLKVVSTHPNLLLSQIKTVLETKPILVDTIETLQFDDEDDDEDDDEEDVEEEEDEN